MMVHRIVTMVPPPMIVVKLRDLLTGYFVDWNKVYFSDFSTFGKSLLWFKSAVCFEILSCRYTQSTIG